MLPEEAGPANFRFKEWISCAYSRGNVLARVLDDYRAGTE